VTESTALEAPAGPAAVELLQAIADPVRWTVLATLADGPRCVCRLQEQVTVPANLLSYHLKVLRDCGLVTTTRRGRWIDYALAAGALARLRDALPGAHLGVA
jgi:ArsR family transcriptional regulator